LHRCGALRDPQAAVLTGYPVENTQGILLLVWATPEVLVVLYLT
jgi:hypothetical protein